MNKIFITSGIFAMALIINNSVSATSPTVTPRTTPAETVVVSPTKAQSVEDKIIETFKEKIATKVAELNKKNQKPVVGEITGIKADTISVKTNNGSFAVKIDATLTKLFQVLGTSKKEIKLTDLDKGSYIIVTGPQLDSTVEANSVYEDIPYFTKSGKITEVNTDGDTIKVITSEKDVITLDITTQVRLQMIDPKTLEIDPTTLAKIKEGDTIHFVYKKTGDEKVPNRFNAEKVLIIPQEYFQK